MADYANLVVWRRAHDIVLKVYEATADFPSKELFGLTAQVRRGAVSIPANIAEGTGRGTQPELARFCRIALGSANEVEYYLRLSYELKYLAEERYIPLAAAIRELRRMLTRFIQSLQRTNSSSR